MYATRNDAVIDRNAKLDESLFTQAADFEVRYTHKAREEANRYRRELYAVVDAVETWPAEIAWPEMPHLETQEEYNASLPHAEAICSPS